MLFLLIQFHLFDLFKYDVFSPTPTHKHLTDKTTRILWKTNKLTIQER